MNNIKDIKDFRKNIVDKMDEKEKEIGFLNFLQGVKNLNLNREQEIETLYKIRGVK